jgi:hypothetical protein
MDTKEKGLTLVSFVSLVVIQRRERTETVIMVSYAR